MNLAAGEIALLTVGISNLGVMIKILVDLRAKNGSAQTPALPATDTAGKGNGKGNGHPDVVVAHTGMLEAHKAEIEGLKTATSKFERDNREDHQKIFGKLDDLKDLIIERQPGAGG